MTANRHPSYSCPNDGSPLALNGPGLSCPSCGNLYPIKEDIALLDCVQRNDRSSFDASAASVAELTEGQRAMGKNRASALLTEAGVGSLESASVLDIGCGFGDLTYGMAACGRLRNCDIYAVDHSVESLRVLRDSKPALNGNAIHLSTQDASTLCFPVASIDFAVGSAVLHHILDYPAFLASLVRLLKPGGKVVFAEPFLPGYFLTSLLLAIAVDQLKLTEKELRRPEFGMCSFFLKDTAFRVQNQEDRAALDVLTDKHYFRQERITELAFAMGFSSVQMKNYEPPEFYADFMRHLLSVYGVTDRRLRQLAADYYEVFRKLAGPSLPELISHFKYIILTK